MKNKIIIYTRVSDPSQVDNNSLETQEKVCRQFAKAKDFEVDRVFREEGWSAKNTDRPELRKALAHCCVKSNKITHLLVYNFKRFSRNTHEGLAVISLLSKNDVEVISATEFSEMNSIGRAMRTVFMAFGQMENEMKGEVVKDNMQSAFRKGLWVFKCPVGYKRKHRSKQENKGQPPVIDSNLAPIITKMFRNASTGIYNKSQLAKMMNLDGFGDHYISKRKKTRATHKVVHNILTKTFYYGEMYSSTWDEYSTGLHEPLIDELTWKKAYHAVVSKKKNYSFQDKELYPLKGAIRCFHCEHPMTTSPSRGKSGIVYYYECRKKNCKKVRININKAHDQFDSILANIKPSDDVIDLFQNMVFSEWDKVVAESGDEIEKMEEAIYALKSEIKSIRKAKDDGLYTLVQAKEEVVKIQREIVSLEIELSDKKVEKYDTEIVREFTNRFLKNLSLLWEKMGLSKKQAFLKQIFYNDLRCTTNGEIRTPKLSPSFELIQALGEAKGENVTLTLPHPHQLIADILDLFNTFADDLRGLSYNFAV